MAERKAAQPFFFEGTTRDHVGVLIVHGFTGSPAEMRPLGLHLNRAGFTVHGVVLAHHGHTPDQLRGTTHHQWVASARDGLDALRRRCQRVFVAGLSLGGLVALHLAARDRALGGIVVMAAPFALNDRRAKVVRFAKYVRRYYSPLAKTDFSSLAVREELRRRIPDIELNFDDPAAVKAIRQSARIPLDAIDQLLRFNALVVRELRDVRAPALFMQGRRDRTVAPDSAERLCAGVRSDDTRVVWLENSGHVLPIEPDKDAVFAEAEAFIRARSG